MCYPPPGPRCSSHANAEWLKHLAALEEEQDTNKRIRLQVKADAAFRAFNATPRGQNRLLREIGGLENTPENKDELAKLSLQLRDGQLTRKNQIAAFLAVKNHKESSIKTLLQTNNKQEQAVGIAFHVLMRLLPEKEGDNAHILSNNLIQAGSSKILCLPQKHQRHFGTIKEEEDGYLSSADLPVELLDVFADFAEPTTITPNHIPSLVEWFVSELKEQGILFLASVDVKTESVVFDQIDSLLDHYKVSFKQKKKLGGTAPYIHGATDLLKESVMGTPLENCDITVATVREKKRTYILDTPHIESDEVQSKYFHFAARQTPDGSRFLEVRTRHQSSQKELFISFSRKALVLPKLDESFVKQFIFDNFAAIETTDTTQ
jgi:hypothetical protein